MAVQPPIPARATTRADLGRMIPLLSVSVSPNLLQLKEVMVGSEHSAINRSPFDVICQIKVTAGCKFEVEKHFVIVPRQSTVPMKFKLVKNGHTDGSVRVVLGFLPATDEKWMDPSNLFRLGYPPIPLTIRFQKESKWPTALSEWNNPIPIGAALSKMCLETGVIKEAKRSLTLSEFTVLDMALSDEIEIDDKDD